jgi:hypothetical protein
MLALAVNPLTEIHGELVFNLTGWAIPLNELQAITFRVILPKREYLKYEM